ncbi:MAG TPA: hypothetical protein VHK91_16520 [Flavisolibacter sp.]|jgi:hypothetical protein|nr:hypothetical protein [Flavisolibacter sp.]
MYKWTLTLCLLVALASCRKAAPVSGTGSLKNSQDPLGLSKKQGGDDPQVALIPGAEDIPTLIDYQLPNPYTPQLMRLVYQQVLGYDYIPPVTNLYVRFKPNDVGQLKQLTDLADAQGFILSDEPMDYHIVQEGDYYQDPSIPVEQITWYYAVVAAGFSPPSGFTYQVLSPLHLPDNELIEARAELLAGLNADGDNYSGGRVSAGKLPAPDQECPDGYHSVNGICVADNPPPPPPASSQIKVYDTQLPYGSTNDHPLRGARIIARRWFKSEITYTDNNGNFTLNKKFRNKIKVFVEMKNNLANIRSIRGVRVWQTMNTVKKKIGVFAAISIPSIEYTFRQGGGISSAQNRYWAAATTLNTVQEHRDYAAQLGFLPPPTGLNIYLTVSANKGGAGSTPLFNKRRILGGVPASINNFLASSPTAITGGLAALNPVFAAANVDVSYDYNITDQYTPIAYSDRVKETLYHELSHASHYSQIGDVAYKAFVDAELTEIIMNPGTSPYNPYGPGNTATAPIIALGEAWAYHMGHYLADIRYGTLGSTQSEQRDENGLGIGFFPNGSNHTHIDVLEYFNPNLASDPFRWIPI